MKIVLVLMAAFSISGCASILSDSTQPVSINTSDCKGARCILTNSEGIYYANDTPTTIIISKAFGDLTAVCKKDGKSATSIHKSSANAATFGNILLGGIPGALIDGGTGKGYDYPSSIINPLSCDK
jgi:uncharacterized protein YceK